MKKVKWNEWPSDDDFEAANNYLYLLGMDRLRHMDPIQQFRAKDVLRASGLQLLKEGSEKVESKIEKVKNDKPLSPIILVRGNPLIIADGFHRICALYYVNPEVEVHCVFAAP